MKGVCAYTKQSIITLKQVASTRWFYHPTARVTWKMYQYPTQWQYMQLMEKDLLYT